MGLEIELREVQPSDVKQIFAWRNRADIRSKMFQSREIPWDEHVAFFASLPMQKTKKFLIAQEKSLGSVGVVNFSDLGSVHATGFWGFYVGVEGTTGIGSAMGIAALDYAFTKLKLFKLCGEVLARNTPSLNYHRKLGFREEGRFVKQLLVADAREDVVRFGLLREEWLASPPANC